MQTKQVAIKASKLIKFNNDGTAIVSEKVLDDIIRNAQKITDQKNFVPGNEIYKHGYPALQGFLTSARSVTQTLINDGRMPTDKYFLLSCKTKSFGKQNVLVNTILSDLRDQDRMEAIRQREENPNSTEAKQPFTEEQLANISGNPDLNNPESHVVDETTKDGGRFRFDKINYEITIFKPDGTTTVLKLAPEGSWRFTVLKWIKKFIDAISSGLTTAGSSIKSGFKKVFGFMRKKPEADLPPVETDLAVVNGQIVETETAAQQPPIDVKEEAPVPIDKESSKEKSAE